MHQIARVLPFPNCFTVLRHLLCLRLAVHRRFGKIYIGPEAVLNEITPRVLEGLWKRSAVGA